MLRAYQHSGHTTVSIEDVLGMLGADPDAPPEPQAQAPRDPRVDFMTGTMWAGPPGSRPPG
jgi:hypothetical protein